MGHCFIEFLVEVFRLDRMAIMVQHLISKLLKLAFYSSCDHNIRFHLLYLSENRSYS